LAAWATFVTHAFLCMSQQGRLIYFLIRLDVQVLTESDQD